MTQREEQLDKKADHLEAREEQLNAKYKDAERIEQEAQQLHEQQQQELERIANMTMEDAKNILISRIQKDAYHDAAVMVREIESRAKEEADKKARNIISLAIQKCAADHVAETTVSVVALPNDDMKGRIIGREGPQHPLAGNGDGRRPDHRRHARGRDHLRVRSGCGARSPASRWRKLITDGRIHPGRIEEMVEKARREVDQPDPRSGRAGRV